MTRGEVIAVVEEAIIGRLVLEAHYVHAADSVAVWHELAPFEIGSSNPSTAERFYDALFAYSYTHRDDKTGLAAPKVCRFNVPNFLTLAPTGRTFDEAELAELNRQATRYDYKTCRFNLVPERNWFRQLRV